MVVLLFLLFLFSLIIISNNEVEEFLNEEACTGSRCRVKVLGGGRYEVDGFPKDDGYPKCGCSLSGYCGCNCQGRYWLKEQIK